MKTTLPTWKTSITGDSFKPLKITTMKMYYITIEDEIFGEMSGTFGAKNEETAINEAKEFYAMATDTYIDCVKIVNVQKVEELTEKQKAIKNATFKCYSIITEKWEKISFDVENPFNTNDGRRAYPVTGQNNCAFTEDMLMTAIYKGQFKQGLVNLKAK